MDVVVRIVRAQHRSCRRGALFLCVVVVLDADPAKYRVTLVRDIAGRVYIGGAGPAAFVDENAVFLGDRLVGEGWHYRLDSDTSHGEVARHSHAAGSRNRLNSVRPF